MTQSSTSPSARDSLFISYAYEDEVFARWLALRLASEGYNVWFDQYKLLGGDNWPRDIDSAIKNRTFRMLAIMSRSSIDKPNPSKERTMALAVARSEKISGFLIPLNLDGMAPTELDWLTTDLTFIPFNHSWASGLTQLLKVLARDNCPRVDRDGRELVSRCVGNFPSVVKGEDLLTSNVTPFVAVPEIVTLYAVKPGLPILSPALRDAKRDWACYPVSPTRVLAFHPPTSDLASWLHVEPVCEYEWRDRLDIEGIPASQIVMRLLRASIETKFQELGFMWSGVAEAYKSPPPFKKRYPVSLANGTSTTVQLSGERTYFRVGQPKTLYRYWQAVQIAIVPNLGGEFSAVWRLKFHFTDSADIPLPEKQTLSRRKAISKSWFNYEWLVRLTALLQHCSDSDGLITVGEPNAQQVILNCHPAALVVNKRIDEAVLNHIEPRNEIDEFDERPEEDEPDDDDDT